MAERDTAALLHEAMRTIAKAGTGVVLYLRREGRGAEILESGKRSRRAAARAPSTDPGTQARDFREYGLGAQILRDVGVRKIRLLSNFPRNLVSLPGYGLEILECVPLRLSAGKPPRKLPARAVARRRSRVG
jgi:3,4-dihydroxy 2-butanone 4-phosphate synthase/GTP cyclohydrolase II